MVKAIQCDRLFLCLQLAESSKIGSGSLIGGIEMQKRREAI